MTPTDLLNLKVLWLRGDPTRDIARVLGVAISTLRENARRLGLPPRPTLRERDAEGRRRVSRRGGLASAHRRYLQAIPAPFTAEQRRRGGQAFARRYREDPELRARCLKAMAIGRRIGNACRRRQGAPCTPAAS